MSPRFNGLAALAQLVEHRIRNAEVGCSSHLRGTIVRFSGQIETRTRRSMPREICCL